MNHAAGSVTSVAVLMTCHNRRKLTLGSLRALHASRLNRVSELVVYLVDDGSVDGTADAVRQAFPGTIIIEGDGNLYWTRGTRAAFDAAMRVGHNFYLWLNDDLFLYDTALETLLATYDWAAQVNPYSIIVGPTEDPETGEVTYGGQVHTSKWHPLRLELVAPQEDPRPCDTVTGNCVLIPSLVADRAGNLDPTFTQVIGDTDYGFRAGKLGCHLWVAPGFVGALSRNPIKESWQNPEQPIRDRWQKMMGPKGIPPRDWRILLKRVAGPRWPLLWVLPYLRLTARSLIPRKKRSP